MAEDELRRAVQGRAGWRIGRDGRAVYQVRGTDRRGVVRPILASADRRARWHAAVGALTLTTETAQHAVTWVEAHLLPRDPAPRTKPPHRGHR